MGVQGPTPRHLPKYWKVDSAFRESGLSGEAQKPQGWASWCDTGGHGAVFSNFRSVPGQSTTMRMGHCFQTGSTQSVREVRTGSVFRQAALRQTELRTGHCFQTHRPQTVTEVRTGTVFTQAALR